MLTIHHLGISQSERILWLCEELEIPYQLVKHDRDPIVAPASLKGLPGNGVGMAPFIEDSDAGITLGESSAICDYIIGRYGNGRLQAKPSDKNFPTYLYWFHYANASLQPHTVCTFFVRLVEAPATKSVSDTVERRLQEALQHVDARLSESKWLAGNNEDDFSAADIMTVYCLTTQRYWCPFSLSHYPGILRYLKDCCARPAYQRAMQKGDPEMKLLSEADAPEETLMKRGGSTSDTWRKS